MRITYSQFEKTCLEKEDRNKIAQLPANRKLKYLALAIISVSIVLLLVMLIWFESLSREAFLIMRGCAGLFAILFAIIVTIYLYRINKTFNKQRYKYKFSKGEGFFKDDTDS